MLLFSALKCVPLVKLDAVDECMKLFTEAVELMESSLELDDDDERPSSASSQSGGASNLGGSNAAAQSKLLSLSASTASTASNSSASSSDSEVDTRTGVIAPLQNKAIAGVAMTIDYSSPGSKTRSLGKQSAAPKGVDGPAGGSSRAGGGSTALGIGLKGTGGGGSASAGPAKPGVLGLHGAHKPSSRATASQNAMSGSSSPHSGGGVSSPVSPASPEDAAEATPEGIAAAAGGALRPPTNKLVTKISGAPQSREYPSPKLGPRSLSVAQGRATPPPAAAGPAANGTAPAPAPPANAAAAGLSLPMPDSLGRDAGTLPLAAGAASPDADDEGGPDDEDAGDLIRADKKNNVFNRVKGTLPVTASPKQIRSSFHLLELATSNSLLQQDQENADDLTMQRQGGSASGDAAVGEAKPASARNSPLMSQGGTLSSLPSGLVSGGSGSTPKPAYLRRLDSPETHHGQLIAAKARLQMLINRGLQVADKVRMDKVPEIKAALEKALAKLEASLVTTTINQG